jgi:hypothetical protein
MALTKRPPVNRIPIPALKPGASRLYKAAHYGLTLLFEDRGGYPATLSPQRLAVMVNARLKRVPKYEHAAVTKHVVEAIIRPRKRMTERTTTASSDQRQP